MSNTKTVMGQAANTQGIPLDITDVFSTFVYEGDGSARSITNGIDLAGEGGLVWSKSRSSGVGVGDNYHLLFDTERGTNKYIFSNATNAEVTSSLLLSSFNSDGYSIGTRNGNNQSGQSYASWTFRKAPKFFDVVTYTGDGASSQTIPHNLNAEVGCLIVKALNQGTWNWRVYHRTQGSGVGAYLDSNSPFGSTSVFPSTHSTTDFTVAANAEGLNASGEEYVAYLFAHNDGDGGFGPSGDQDIIKCGSYTGNGSTTGPEIDLGFEPQWLLVKNASASANWTLLDVMRGLPVSGSNQHTLLADSTAAELVNTSYQIQPLSGGFQPTSTNGLVNASGNTYIYMAIRRGPLAQPESGTEVFDVSTRNASEPAYTSGFPVDFAFARAKNIANNWDTGSRLQQGNRMFTNLTNAEATNSNMMFDYQEGWSAGTGASTDYLSWMWKRAPGFFDVVAYTGDGTYPRNIAHNLSATPEMVIIKARNWSSGNWAVHHKDLGYSTVSYLDNVLGSANQPHFLTASDASTFTVGSATSFSNYSNSASYNYIAYLFATRPGVSKVGSYTGNGTSQTIDCGFTSGARFILVKRTDSTGDWYVWDTERGIVAGNDPHLSLNTTAAEVTSDDSIDPDSSGFIVNQVAATNINVTSASYIFYAIA